MENKESCYIEKLAKKYATSVKNYQLVKYYEAAFPVYDTVIDLTLQKSKPLGKVDEFCLRYIGEGIKNAINLTNFLGLKTNIIENHIINLYQQDLIDVDLKNLEKPRITEKGIKVLNSLKLIEPENISYKCIIDGLTGELRNKEYLRKMDDIKKMNIQVIPRYIITPNINIIEKSKVNELIRNEQKQRYRSFLDGDILNINKIESLELKYNIMNVLVFSDESGNIDLQVYDRGQRIREYENVLLKMIDQRYNIVELDLKISDIDNKENNIIHISNDILDEAMNSQVLINHIEEEIDELEKEIEENIENLDEDDENYESKTQIIEVQRKEIEELKIEINNKPKMLSTYDHRPIMLDALKKAKKQLIIVSPWVRKDVVDNEFKKLLKEALIRNVNVIICYGIDDKEDFYTEKALQALKDIQNSHKNGKLLFLIKLGNTHEKVLICDDDFMVSTSFNWLSFKGDPKRGFRQETGIFLKDKKCIKDMLDNLENRIRLVDNDMYIYKFNL